MPDRDMNIVFVWTGITGYMGDCWRALAAQPGVRLKVLVEAPKAVVDAAFDAAHELRGLDCTIVEMGAPFDRAAIRDSVAAFRPDAIFIVGWHAALPRFIAEVPSFANVWKAIVFDLPFERTIRKFLAPIALWRYLRRFDAAFVPGAAAARYARWLGFKPESIQQGLFSTRLNRFDAAARERLGKNGAPHSFLFVGRYAPEKGLDTLARAYRIYRAKVSEPWPLDCVGKGPAFPQCEGMRDLGFVPPDNLAAIYGSHGVFILPSRFEPWGVVLAEACGAAMPVICTEPVGARHELVDGNGFVCRDNDAESLAEAMTRMHNLSDAELHSMSARSIELSRPYSSEAWARRVVDFVRKGNA